MSSLRDVSRATIALLGASCPRRSGFRPAVAGFRPAVVGFRLVVGAIGALTLALTLAPQVHAADRYYVGPDSGSNNVYVADGNNRIQKFTATGIYLTQWGSAGRCNGRFNQPYGVAKDATGNVYVADYFNNRLQQFTSTGTYLAQWGSYGSGDGQFQGLKGVATDAGGSGNWNDPAIWSATAGGPGGAGVPVPGDRALVTGTTPLAVTFDASYASPLARCTINGGGTHVFADGLTISSSGQLTGAGTITGNVISRGLVAPGSSAGKITITGNFSGRDPGSVLSIEVGGTAPGAYDQLAVTGGATVGGACE